MRERALLWYKTEGVFVRQYSMFTWVVMFFPINPISIIPRTRSLSPLLSTLPSIFKLQTKWCQDPAFQLDSRIGETLYYCYLLNLNITLPVSGLLEHWGSKSTNIFKPSLNCTVCFKALNGNCVGHCNYNLHIIIY